MSFEKFNIGIDFGGVLSSHDVNIGAEHVNTAIDMPFAMENLMKLKGLGHKLFLISFCGKARAIETLQSLKESMITESMSCADIFDEIFFVKDRKNKKELCEYLNCHFMVDDREDILVHVVDSLCKTIPILYGSEETTLANAKVASDWNKVTDLITATPHFVTNLNKEKPIKMIYDI